MLSSDGKVAEHGTFKELSNNRDGAFTKLMEWQMSGGESNAGPDPKGSPSDLEDMMQALGEQGEVGEDIEEEGLKVRGEEESKSEAVLEKVSQ